MTAALGTPVFNQPADATENMMLLTPAAGRINPAHLVISGTSGLMDPQPELGPSRLEIQL